MKIIEVKVYEFLELSKEAKEKAIENYHEDKDFDYLEDIIFEYIENELDTEKCFSNIRGIYSLGYSQGDGLSFSADFNLKNWLNQEKYSNIDRSVIDMILDNFKVNVKMNEGYYCFASASDIELYSYDDEIVDSINDVVETIQNDLSEYYLNICKQAEKFGYAEYEYKESDGEFAELANDNDWYFLENGKLYSI